MFLTFNDALVYVVSFFGLYTAIFYLWTLLEHQEKARTTTRLARAPRVAVIVPCYNEARTVGTTIESLLALDYPRGKLEIIVVDDGSTDETSAVAKRYARHGVKVYRKRNGGKHTALNLGLSRTRAEFVAALDADSTVEPTALRRLLARFTDERVMAVTPSMKIRDPKGVLRRIQSVEFTMGIFLRRVFADLGSQHVAPGPFTVFRRKFFLEHGAYRAAHNTEDIEIALRIQSKRYQVENATDAYVSTHGPGTFKSLYKQRLRWYYGFLSNVLDYKHLFGKKYGNLGLFVLPSALLSIFLVIVSAGYVLGKMALDTWRQLSYYAAVGFDLWEMLELNFDVFFVDTSAVMFLAIVGLVTGLVVYLYARSLAQDREGWTLSYAFFFLFYWLLFGFWWFVAGLYKLFGGTVEWHDKSKYEKVN